MKMVDISPYYLEKMVLTLGSTLDPFFTKVREDLDIIPAQVRILEYMQEKAVFIELQTTHH